MSRIPKLVQHLGRYHALLIIALSTVGHFAPASCAVAQVVQELPAESESYLSPTDDRREIVGDVKQDGISKCQLELTKGTTVKLFVAERPLQVKATGAIDENVVHIQLWIDLFTSSAEAQTLWNFGARHAKVPSGINYTKPYGFVLYETKQQSMGLAFLDECTLFFRELQLHPGRDDRREEKSVELVPLQGFVRSRLGSANGQHVFSICSLRFEGGSWITEVEMRGIGERFVLKRVASGEWIEVSTR